MKRSLHCLESLSCFGEDRWGEGQRGVQAGHSYGEGTRKGTLGVGIGSGEPGLCPLLRGTRLLVPARTSFSAKFSVPFGDF